MKTDKEIIENLLSISESVRRLHMRGFQRFVDKKCNEPMTEKEIEKKEKKLEKEFCQLLNVELVPSFFELYGDPRGFVLKILTDRLNIDNAREYMRSTGLASDWGGDYAIVSDKYLPN